MFFHNYDYACRYGGEEFAVILPHTEAEAGRLVAERIREAVYWLVVAALIVLVASGCSSSKSQPQQQGHAIPGYCRE